MRRGLWDLDLSLNRAFVYSALTALLVAVYFLVVVLVQAVVNDVAGIKGSTAGRGDLHRVDRRRSRCRPGSGSSDVIDRVFFRRRYDLERTVESFEARLQRSRPIGVGRSGAARRCLGRLRTRAGVAVDPGGAAMRWRRRPSGDEPSRRSDRRPAYASTSTDPFVAYLITADAPVDVRDIDFDTPLVQSLRDVGAELVVPIIAQSELVGVLSLGPRKGGQSYNAEDRRLLHRLATRAAPALRLAEVMRTQAAQAGERERMAQELRVARLIQQQFLPTTLPEVPGWRIGTYYRPAQEVGGDFYDFLQLPDGRIGVVIGDVSGKGVPAALVMATTRSLLREVAQQVVEPAGVLERVNRALVGDIPRNMFVTCQYAAIDPTSGKLTLANAGHNVPYLSGGGDLLEVRATGMPLGIMGDARYDEKAGRRRDGRRLAVPQRRLGRGAQRRAVRCSASLA